MAGFFIFLAENRRQSGNLFGNYGFSVAKKEITIFSTGEIDAGLSFSVHQFRILMFADCCVWIFSIKGF